MSVKSKNSRQITKPDIERPFEAGILAKAVQIVQKYKFVLEFTDGEFFGQCLELPGACGDGKTPDACLTHTRESAVAVAAYMLEKGQKLPIPAREGIRTEQVNIRLSSDEKAAISANADRFGFKGLADYMRTAAITGLVHAA